MTECAGHAHAFSRYDISMALVCSRLHIRPILWEVNPDAKPPSYAVLLVGRPHRTVTFELPVAVSRDIGSVELQEIGEMEKTRQEVLEPLALPLDRDMYGFDFP
jgi:hypothetical protein